MQVLFCHDGPLRVDENNNYYGIAHNDEMFKRYKTIAENISTVIRLKRIKNNEHIDRLSKITISPFKVYEIPNISSARGILLKKRKAKTIIKNAVLESDYIVARLPSMSGFIAIDYALKFNKPYLTEVVACPWGVYWNHSLKGKLVAPYMYFATKKRVKESKYVVYVTNEFLQKRYPTGGKNVNCSNVALTEFNDNILKRRLDKINRMKANEKVIIGTTAAVDVRYKGQQYIIKALGKLKKQGIVNYEYHLVGPGDPTYLKSVAKKNDVIDQVKFIGPLPHKEVFDWLETIDLYTQPSRQEGLPRALIEAMSRGVPSFGANTAGIPELLEDDYIFSNSRKNIEEICNIILNYTRKKMKLQAIQNYKISKKYSKNIIDEKRRAFFNDFILGIL